MKLISIFLTISFLAINAFSQTVTTWKISDYLKNLPAKYKTFEGNGLDGPERRVTIIDDKNGYAAYQNQRVDKRDAPLRFFEIAKFNSGNGYATLVITNLKDDHVCTEYETFFLQKRGGHWIDVKSQVLPKLNESLFFKDAKSYKRFQKIEKKLGYNNGEFSVHFTPPRNGTRMSTSMEVCDFADESVDEDDFNNYLKLIGETKPIYLKWNKAKGRFELEK